MRVVLTAALAFLVLSCTAPDTTPPRVLGSFPPDGAANVVRSRRVTVTFSESMDPQATASAFSIAPAVTGSLGWPNSTALEFAPLPPFDTNTTYTVTVSTAARDAAGNTLEQPAQFSFTTGTRLLSPDIAMLGRSVLEGWFYHWGWDGNDQTPVARGSFNLYHRSVASPDPPEAMLASVRLVCDSIPQNAEAVVFFKLCFVDFNGGSQLDAESSLARNQRIVDGVCDIVLARSGLSLVIGTALPRTEAETDQWLYWNHARYNDYVNSIEAAHAGRVHVFDLYSVLTDPGTHAIRSNYATGPDDAHPNSAGYSALDSQFFPFLEDNF